MANLMPERAEVDAAKLVGTSNPGSQAARQQLTASKATASTVLHRVAAGSLRTIYRSDL